MRQAGRYLPGTNPPPIALTRTSLIAFWLCPRISGRPRKIRVFRDLQDTYACVRDHPPTDSQILWVTGRRDHLLRYPRRPAGDGHGGDHEPRSSLSGAVEYPRRRRKEAAEGGGCEEGAGIRIRGHHVDEERTEG